jgi:haloalkane dehalogenase
MQVMRTPDARFTGIPDWEFAPRHFDLPTTEGAELRLHYVQEGPADAAPVLLMHGEPSWAYLYRRIIPGLASKGHRVLAPDLIGFGRSDKPAARADYSYERHVAWMSAWLTGLDLTGITLFCQDWGGLIGLRLVAAFPERFAAVVVANTGLPIGNAVTEAFNAWLNFSQTVPQLPVGMIVNMGTGRELSPAEIAAYDAPFPDESFKEGARQFPALVPITPEHASVAENKAAWAVLETFDKPFLTAFSDGDPVTKGGEAVFQARVPGTKGQPHVTLKGGHMVQEDSPEDIVELIHAHAARGAAFSAKA